MKDSLVKDFLNILKREDVKNELKTIFTPFINYVLYELNPYIYTIIILVVLIFIMILAILVILIIILRNKQLTNKFFNL